MPNAGTTLDISGNSTVTTINSNLANKYTIITGIDITSDGISLTATKYVSIAVNTNYHWEYNVNGLEYNNASDTTTYLRVGARFSGGSIPSTNCGIYEYNDANNQTLGKLAFVVTDHSVNSYDYLYLQLDHTSNYYYAALLPNSGKGSLGRYDNTFRSVYARQYFGQLGSTTTYITGSAMIYPADTGNLSIIFPAVDITSSYHRTNHTFTLRMKSSSDSVPLTMVGNVEAPSSRAYKQNITDLKDCGDIIDQLLPVSFVYKKDKTKTKRLGLIYEDTINVLPEICSEDDMSQTPKSINYVELVPVLLKEIQCLRSRVKRLEGGGSL